VNGGPRRPAGMRIGPTPRFSRRALLGGAVALATAADVDLVAGCGGSAPASGGVELVRATRTRDAASPADLPAAAGAVQDFSAELFRRVATPDTNLICSPLSVHVALAMTLLGARGRTASELGAVLHADDPARLARGLNALTAALAGRAGTVQRGGGQTGEVAFDLANSLWGQRGISWQPTFLDALAADFGAGMRVVDFVTDPERARRGINGWVGQVTHGTIPDLVAPGAINARTRLALVNALHLKAPWNDPFDPKATRSGSFTLPSGGTVTADFMSADPQLTRYAAGPGWQAVTLPYAGLALAMTVVLPDPGRTARLTQALDGATLRRMITAPQPSGVQLTMPRWTSRTTISLREQLTALGAPTMFTDTADLSGMTASEQLAVDAVLHQGYVAVDENGTEASAATAVMMRTTAAMADIKTVRFDRPFVYVIHDVATATPLFLGQVADPTARS
jgi:serine protease inhibitor